MHSPTGTKSFNLEKTPKPSNIPPSITMATHQRLKKLGKDDIYSLAQASKS